MKSTAEGTIASFLILLSLFIAIRLALLLFSPVLYGDIEELYMGNIAHAALHGRIMPLPEYIYHPHEGGSLLFGFAIVPFFLLMGPSYISLKMTALMFASLAFAMWYLFLLRFYSRRAATIMGFLLCFAPVGYIQLSLWCSAHHTQNAVFDIAILFFFFAFLNTRIQGLQHKDTHHRHGAWRIPLSLMAIISGLAIFFSYFSLFAIGVCFLAWLLRWRNTISRNMFLLFAICFLLGFSPWLIVNLQNNFAGVRSIVALLQEPSVKTTTIFHSAKVFLSSLFLDTYWFNHDIAPFWSYIYRSVTSILIASSVIFVLSTCKETLNPRTGNSPHPPNGQWSLIPISLYLVIFPSVLILFKFDKRISTIPGYFINYRYLSVYYPFLLCAIAILISPMWDSRHRIVRALSMVLLCLIACSCIHPLLKKISWRAVGVGQRYQGYSYYMLGWRVAQKGNYWNNINAGLRLAQKIASPRDRDDYLDGFTEVRWWEAIEDEEPFATIKDMDTATRGKTEKNVSDLNAKILTADEVYRPLFYMALGRVLSLRYVYEKPLMFQRCLALANLADREYRSWCYYGMGYSAGSALTVWHTAPSRLAGMIPEQFQDVFQQGMAKGVRTPYIQISQFVPFARE